MAVFPLFCRKNRQKHRKKPFFVYRELLGKRASGYLMGTVGLSGISEGRVGPRGETPGTQNRGAMSLRMEPHISPSSMMKYSMKMNFSAF